AFVEDKTTALVGRPTGFFKILENVALKLVDVFEPDILHVNGGVLTPNATGTETDHGLVFELLPMRLHLFGELGEFTQTPVDSPFKGAFIDFKIIAGIQ